MNAPTRTAEATALGSNDILEARPHYAVAPLVQPQALILESSNFTALLTVAKIMANSKGMPKHLRGDEGMCLAVVMQAMRWNMDPFAVATKTYVTEEGGVLRYEGQLVIAVINNSGLLANRLSFEWFGEWERIVGKFERRQTKKKDRNGQLVTDANGEIKTYLAPTYQDSDEDGLGIRVSATLRGESRPRETTFLMKQARVRNSTLWAEDPKQQITYVASRRWGSIHTPDAILGVAIADDWEAKDMGMVEEVPTVPDVLVKSGDEAARRGMPVYQEWWKARTHAERDLLDDRSDWHEKFKQIAAEASQLRGGTKPPTNQATPAPTAAPTPAPTAAPAADQSSNTDPTSSTDPKMTYAKVMDMLVKAFEAKNTDALEIAADWIGEVADPEHRKELTAKYEGFMKQLQPQT
jgi:hypothetical protein